MPGSSLWLIAAAVGSSLFGSHLWHTGLDTGPAKAAFVEAEWTTTVAPLTSPAPAPAPDPLKVREEARQAPPSEEKTGGSPWLLPVALGVVLLASGGASLWSRNRPVVSPPVPELCPDFRAPRPASPVRRRRRGSVADARTLDDLASLEFRR